VRSGKPAERQGRVETVDRLLVEDMDDTVAGLMQAPGLSLRGIHLNGVG
jgi:hypothetical protein